MKFVTDDPMHPGETGPGTTQCSGLVAALRDACERATDPTHPLRVRIHLFRSVCALAEVLMQARADAGLPHTLDGDLVARLLAVRDAAAGLVSDPAMAVEDSLSVFRAIRTLADTARQARGPAPEPRDRPGHRLRGRVIVPDMRPRDVVRPSPPGVAPLDPELARLDRLLRQLPLASVPMREAMGPPRKIPDAERRLRREALGFPPEPMPPPAGAIG
jgi:hypothetical protein